jgi:hypothetical protein
MENDMLRAEMIMISEAKDLVADEGFVQKMLQLKQLIEMRHNCGSSGIAFWKRNLHLYK